MAKARGIRSPSSNPFALATDQLPVAIALAPAVVTAFALPASQTLKSTSGFPGTWSARNCSALPARSFIASPWYSRSRLLCCLPVRAQLLIELLPALLGEEDPRILELDPTPRARDRLGQP